MMLSRVVLRHVVGVVRCKHVTASSVADAVSGFHRCCSTSNGRPLRQLGRQQLHRLQQPALRSRERVVSQLWYSRSKLHIAASETDGNQDKLVPADSYITWTRGGAVKLRLAESGPAAEKPQSVMTFFRRTVERLPDYDALVYKVDGSWKSISYGQYYDNVRQVARGFIELGLEPQSAVGILGFNSPEWTISSMAAIFAGAYSTGIYLTNSPDACHHVADHARCNIIVVDDDLQLQKILSIRSRLPHLKAIIQYRGKPDKELSGVYSWSQLMEIGSQSLERDLEARIREQAPNKGCMLVYTSGTTGDPKGAMLSHDNVVWTSYQCRTKLGVEFGQPWKIVSYLPLSHVAAGVSDIFCPIVVAATVYFAEPDALKGSLGKTLKEVRPNHFFAVPRVWEKMQEAITAAGKGSGPIKRRIIGWAKETSLNGTRALMDGRKIPLSSRVSKALIMRKVHEALGIDRCDVCVSAAAPIARSTIDFFLSLGIPLVEVYGMTEASGPHTIGMRFDNAIGSVGRELAGSNTYIDQPDKNGVGELLLHGRNVFMGYLDMENMTKQSFSGPAGTFYHTGDLGRRDERGFLYVSGRIKEILITSGGENIPRTKIELAVKERLSVISNCMLLGDGRKYLTMLLTVKTDVNMDTMTPLDTLTSDVISWCHGLGSGAKTAADFIADVKVHDEIQKGIDDVNSTATSNAQKIQKWIILPRDFSIAGGELGPTLKLRRHIVLKKYDQVIESLYPLTSQ